MPRLSACVCAESVLTCLQMYCSSHTGGKKKIQQTNRQAKETWKEMVPQMGQSTVQYWELGHRSLVCCMEDNMMNRPYNSTCSLCFNLPLCYVTEASSSDPAGRSQGETEWGHLRSRVLQLSQPGRDCSGEAAHSWIHKWKCFPRALHRAQALNSSHLQDGHIFPFHK